MNIKIITSIDSEWKYLIEYAENCSWRAGKNLAHIMRKGKLVDWERVIVATEGNEIAGYCTVMKEDCIPNLPYTPYVSFVFVGEDFRGHRISQQLIQKAMEYVKELGFTELFLTSDHENLYEKYGFTVIDRQMAYWGEEEKIYRIEV